MTWKELIGKRMLVRRYMSRLSLTQEVVVEDVSPSNDYVKLERIRGDGSTYTSWEDYNEYVLLEVLD